jgi:tetratricopeptide (TPR) repeat protein
MVRRIVALFAIPYWSVAYLLMGMDDEYYHIKLGDAYIQLALYWMAVKHFKKALKEKERAWSHMQLGWALFNCNQFDDALQHTRRAYELWPSPILAASLAKTECSSGNYDKAKILVQAARRAEAQLDEPSLAILSETEVQLAAVESSDRTGSGA